jgi:glycosyltransferase involved in cell wall biosynthesis
MERYKVSVIIATYNYAAYLPDCLESLRVQSMQDFEIIVIDDASTDNTSEIIGRYKKVFGDRLNYLKLEKRVGRGGVRNYGLRLAKGAYIAFLDADDVYCPEKIEVQSKYLDDHPDMGGVSCQYYYVNSSLKEPSLNTGAGSLFEILFGCEYSNFQEEPGAVMVQRKVIDQVGHFDERISRGQDTDMMVRIARVSKIGFIYAPLFLYRYHDTNHPSLLSLRERAKSNAVLYKKIIDTEEDSRKYLARQFAFESLQSHIFSLRERLYFYPILVWFFYLYEFKFDLPLRKWAILGVKTVVGYRFTQFIKRNLRGLFPLFLRDH